MRTRWWLMVVTVVLTGCRCAASVPALGTEESTELAPTRQEEEIYAVRRKRLVENAIRPGGVSDPDVLRAMETVPRHRFVPDELREMAYGDRAMPIGYGQTISQPSVVAWMTQQLSLAEGERVLEVGTGSGYQAAVLAELGCCEVYSIEIIPELAERAKRQLEAEGYQRLHVRQGDGYYGWEEEGPFDAIIVTAAPDHLPRPLVQQLADAGRLVIPIGPTGSIQTLWKFVNEPDGLRAYNLGLVVFVPLTGGGAAEPEPEPIP
jgi:protein-L-isoaspartate(D-aspartate) O-methyltransferase